MFDKVKKDEMNEHEHIDDEFEIEEAEEQLTDKVKTLRNKLKVCEDEKLNVLEDLQRTKADFLNSKRRLTEQLAIDRERVVENVLTDFLPLLDSFDTALAHTDTGESKNDTWRKGVEVMHSQFMALLKSYDIEEITAEHAPFNPHEHEAVSSKKSDTNETIDTVLEVLQKGFKRGETIIRPAKVVVGT